LGGCHSHRRAGGSKKGYVLIYRDQKLAVIEASRHALKRVKASNVALFSLRQCISGTKKVQNVAQQFKPKWGKKWGIKFAETSDFSMKSYTRADLLVEQRGIEPLTSSLRTTRSPN